MQNGAVIHLPCDFQSPISISFHPTFKKEHIIMGNFFQGGLPPLPGTGPDYMSILLNMVFAVLWSIVAAIGFAAAIAIGFRVLNVLTPGLNEWEELKKGNIAVGIVWAAFTLAVAVVVYVVLNK
jgi:hypothetical protein